MMFEQQSMQMAETEAKISGETMVMADTTGGRSSKSHEHKFKLICRLESRGIGADAGNEYEKLARARRSVTPSLHHGWTWSKAICNTL